MGETQLGQGDGPMLWWRGALMETARVSSNAAGHAVLSGWFTSPELDFDPGQGSDIRKRSGDNEAGDFFLLGLDPEQNLAWAHTLGGATASGDVAVTPEGGVVLAGHLFGSTDLDPGPGVVTFAQDWPGGFFVLALDGAGNYAWSFGDGGGIDERQVAVADDGSIYVAGGNFTKGVDPAPDLQPPSDTAYNFVSKLTATGKLLWARALPGPVADVAVAKDGGVAIAGNFGGAVDFDPGVAVDTHTGTSQSSAYVVELTSDGDYGWGWHDSAAEPEPVFGDWGGPSQLRATSSGGLVVIGNSWWSFLVQLDAAGSVEWQYQNTYPAPALLATAPDGRVAIAGSFSRGVDLDPGDGVDMPSTSSEFGIDDSNESYISTFAADGSYLGSRTYWGRKYASGLGGLATNSTGELLVAGSCEVGCSLVSGGTSRSATSWGGGDAFLMTVPFE